MDPRRTDIIGAAVLAIVLFGLVAIIVLGNVGVPQA
jgi:nitrate reductase NapE component